MEIFAKKKISFVDFIGRSGRELYTSPKIYEPQIIFNYRQI
jgi:hypothetical protein